eukprot:m.217697 g.217697  ORF g.217697 m.217697 type:complete len:339 (-) comp29241_c0_seq1:87-1103(-)
MDELLNIGASVDKQAPATATDSPGDVTDMDPFLARLLQEGGQASMSGGEAEDPMAPGSILVTPVAGICLKTEASTGEKVFVNVCRSEHVPAPPSVSDVEMAHALATGDNSTYRIPMSVGEPHAELDTSKKGCTAYDVIVSEEAFSQMQAREGIKEFIIELVLSHIEVKHSTLLSRDFKILGKRKRMGQLQQQRIRKKTTIHEVHTTQASKSETNKTARPGISEVGSSNDNASHTNDDTSSAVSTNTPIPKYTLLKEPEEGTPEFYIVEVELPTVLSAATMTVDVGGRRFELAVRPRAYFLGLDFDYPVDHKETGAQFNKKTRRLTVTLPVAVGDHGAD